MAPTEKVGSQVLRGEVHDPTAQRMGGVAGHAGVFTTTADVARFARMILNKGQIDGVHFLKPETVELMTSVQSPKSVTARRGLGWDIDSGYSRPRGDIFPIGSYGHTGFTGVCLWIDPFSHSFWMLFSNRVHPNRSANILPLQRKLGTLAAQAITDFDFSKVAGALSPMPTNSPSQP
jgi:CubicO group peptidase (beta-lactamase class C family)